MKSGRDNALKERFWGRVKIEEAAALFYFQEGGQIQQLIHQIKYNDRPDLARELGRYFGFQLKKRRIYESVTMVIPVPLHPRKFKKRGFNQSREFAIAIAIELGAPLNGEVLARIADGESQTTKSRLERRLNVKDAFVCRNSGLLHDQHILIVDDIVTTGATLEACIRKIPEDLNVRVSVAAIGMANNKLVIQ